MITAEMMPRYYSQQFLSSHNQLSSTLEYLYYQGETVRLQVKIQERLLENHEKESPLCLMEKKEGVLLHLLFRGLLQLQYFPNLFFFSFHDNFPFNLLLTGSTLPYHMPYIPPAFSWRLNLLQNPFSFPICLRSWHLLAAHYPYQIILPTLKSLETPLKANPANALLTLQRSRQSLKDMGESQPMATQN